MKNIQNFTDEFNYEFANEILKDCEEEKSVCKRIDLISKFLIGKPYRVNPIIGSFEEEEKFTLPLDGFDCVTFIETVLSFALSKNTTEVLENARKIRYLNGNIAWLTRNHYMTDWLSRNIDTGLVSYCSELDESVHSKRSLSVLPNYPSKDHELKMCEINSCADIFKKITTPKILLIGSNLENLDYFHTGFLIPTKDLYLFRHSAKSLGGVVEENVYDFINRNEIFGLKIIAINEIKR